MTWREAWSNISGRLAYAAKVQRSEFGGKGFTESDTEAETMAFIALQEYGQRCTGGRVVKIVIPFTLPGLNDYVNAERANRQKGAAFKKKWQNDVALVIKRQVRGKLKEPVVMRYTWFERDKRRDKDNVSAFGRKVIQDALVQIKALQNDGWKEIIGFSDDWAVDKARPRVEIEIIEMED